MQNQINPLFLNFAKYHRGSTTSENYQKVVSISKDFFQRTPFPTDKGIEQVSKEMYTQIKGEFYDTNNVLSHYDKTPKQSKKILDKFFKYLESVEDCYSMRLISIGNFCRLNKDASMENLFPFGYLTFNFQVKIEVQNWWLTSFIDVIEDVSQGVNFKNIAGLTLEQIAAKVET